jgi:hypothetical protein
MRQASDHKVEKGGWIHRLNGTITPMVSNTTIQKLTPAVLIDLNRRYREAVIPGELASLAMKLGVSVDSLNRLGVGWDGSAWTFPMKDGEGTIIGIHRRFPDRKLCLGGSKLGLFIPRDTGDGDRNPLLICEGASDTATAMSAGFDAIGLPSAGQGFDHAELFIRKNSRRHVCIMADLDEGTPLPNGDYSWPGIEYGIRLAEKLMPMVPNLRFILPPDGVKDIRQWFKAVGADPIREAVNRAPRVTPAWINACWQNVESNRQLARIPDWSRQASALLNKVDDPDRRAGLRFEFEERIAICIIDGNLPQDEAERIAYEQIRSAVEVEA